MEEIISQLTHNNNLFDEQWPDTYDRLRSSIIPTDGRLVLNTLVDYILAEPIDPLPNDVKYCFITMIIDQLIDNEISLEISDLVHGFVRILQTSQNDAWHLHCLTTIYEKFRIIERLFAHPSKEQLLEEILRILQTKLFELDDEKWNEFIIERLFSNPIDECNSLNQIDMQSHFQEFYKHAIQHSSQSSIWSQIARILTETLPSDQANTIDSINHIENFIRQNQYDNACSILSKFDISSVNLEEFLRLLIRLCSLVEDRDLFCSDFLIGCIGKLEDFSIDKQYAVLVFELILSILKLSVVEAPKLVFRLLNRKDFYPWKDLIDGLVDLIKGCISYETIINEEYFSDLNELENILELVTTKVRIFAKLSQMIQPMVLDAIFRWADCQFNRGLHVYRMGSVLFNCINLEQTNEEIVGKFIDALQNRIHSNNQEIKEKSRGFFTEMSQHLSNSIEQLKRLSPDTHVRFVNLCSSILDHPLYDEDQNMTFEHAILVTILFKSVLTIAEENHVRLYETFLDRMYNEAKKENQMILYQWWSGCWTIVGYKFQNITRDHCEQFLEYTLTRKEMDLVGILVTICQQRPELVYPHFDILVQILLMNNGEYLSSLTILFTSIVSEHPEIVSSKHLQQIFALLESISFNIYFEFIFQSLISVGNYQPELFDNYQEKLIQLIIERQSLIILECLRKYLLASIIIHRNAHQAKEYLDCLLDLVKNHTCSSDIRNGIFYTCLLVGLNFRQIVIDRREDFVKLNCDLLVNYIDQTISKKNEESIVRRGEEEIEIIEQKIKIHEEIFIPSWTQDVSKLLNPHRDNDWRLLGKHLGFSSSEIKHWAMQNDPCMALLKEWFRSHQTDQAIVSLLKGLVEIKRHDVEQIIQQALAITGTILPTNLSTDLKRLPPVFLSFHSSERIFITKLKDHLNETGYSCQIDDEQTELNTVEAYIRGAKVVVCGINTSYIQTENCAKHCQLSLKMKKPFIVLYTEEQVWPPEGALESIFQEYLYIPFLKDKESSTWSETKFLELLAQIRYHVAPDPDLTSEHYRHWFIPRLDKLIFLQSYLTEKDNLFTDLPLVVSHPQIILSYQWDNQKDVMHLYRQLTQFGYRIWLDIFQMNGGESLSEKCHLSLRQSSCLLACITPKYLKSAHYQDEFLVAKDWKKPMICLLLEETNPWPPSGVNLSLFVGKSYIDFRDGNSQWTGKSFEMLLAQLRKFIPQIHTDKPRHLLEMQRPNSASPHHTLDQQPTRRSSLPIIPKSRACSLM